MLRLILTLTLLADATPERPGTLVWKTSETVGKNGDKVLSAAGTRQGHRYVFRSRGVCRWRPVKIWLDFPFGWVNYEKKESIFGIDFRVTFGGGEPQVLNVGSSKTEQTELSFVADKDDASIRIEDHWDLPKDVVCTIDNIEVVVPPVSPD